MLLGAIATQPVLDVLLAAGADLGGAFQRRRGAAGDVVRRQGRGAAGRRLRAGAGRQSRHRDQSGAGGRRPATTPSARRLPIGNLLNRAVRRAWWRWRCCRGSARWLVHVRARHRPAPSPTSTPASTWCWRLVFLPAAGTLCRGCCAGCCRPGSTADDPSRPRYLDQAALETPAVALARRRARGAAHGRCAGGMLTGAARGAGQRPTAGGSPRCGGWTTCWTG